MNLEKVLFKLLHWPICRFYAKHVVGDKPADETLKKLCSLQFRRLHRYWPNFMNPKSFNEKLWSRMLNCRDPLLTLISDKLRVREYVANKGYGQFLVPMLWQGDNPADIPFNELPLKFVIKTNHGCGFNIIVQDKSTLDQSQARYQLKEWLGVNHCQDFFLGIEWGYKNINPAILIEQFIDENGKPPVDYKFYCFSGCVEFLTAHYDRFIEHKTRSFDRNFEPYDFRYNIPFWNGACERPQNFTTMVQLAESLAADFDFMRVDLYSVENKVYFSELTPYPGGVSTAFLPLSRDYILGEKWNLNVNDICQLK